MSSIPGWLDAVARVYLTEEDRAQLQPALQEVADRQISRVLSDLAEARPANLEQAGFSPAQASYKISSAVESMDASIDAAEDRPKASVLRRRKRQPPPGDAEVTAAAVEAIKELLGSIKGLSKWVEAVSELVGIVGSAVKRNDAKRRARNRRNAHGLG